jgi:hypothetical protein
MGFTRGGDVYIQENACKVTLTRGQRGGYGWEIHFAGNETENVLTEIAAADRKLRELYTEEI